MELQRVRFWKKSQFINKSLSLSHPSFTLQIGAQSVGAAGIASATAATIGATTGAASAGIGYGMVASGASTLTTFPMLGIMFACLYLLLNN